jgi:hypothetical protein
MLTFFPFHLSAIERHPPIKDLILAWLGNNAEVLERKDWFERGHDLDRGTPGEDGFWRPTIREGKFIWAPPPGACEVALEELRKARIK